MGGVQGRIPLPARFSRGNNILEKQIKYMGIYRRGGYGGNSSYGLFYWNSNNSPSNSNANYGAAL